MLVIRVLVIRWSLPNFATRCQQTKQEGSVCMTVFTTKDFLGSSAGLESSCNAGEPSSNPGKWRSPKGHATHSGFLGLLGWLRRYKNLPAMWETWVGKIPWRRAWQPTPVFLPGESPRTEKPGGLQSVGLQRVGHDWVTKHTAKSWMSSGSFSSSLCTQSFTALVAVQI